MEIKKVGTTVNAALLREQRDLLLKIIPLLTDYFGQKPSSVNLLEGVISLLDDILDQAEDCILADMLDEAENTEHLKTETVNE